jgi:hypothetical protein
MIDNVCKFSVNHSSDLICERFVLETRASQAATERARTNFICLVLGGEGILNIDGKEDGHIDTSVSNCPEFILISTEVNGYRKEDHRPAKEAYDAVGDTFLVDHVRVFDIVK